MNSAESIKSAWRKTGRLEATGSQGWTVEFARRHDGSMPALDYIDGTDFASERRFAFTDKHVDRIVGVLETIRSSGTQDLEGSKFFKSFIGEDAKDAMCELRLKAEQGHRFLGFKRDGKRFVIACGFVKPPKYETPPEHKTRAREIMAEHERPRRERR